VQLGWPTSLQVYHGTVRFGWASLGPTEGLFWPLTHRPHRIKGALNFAKKFGWRACPFPTKTRKTSLSSHQIQLDHRVQPLLFF